MTRALCLLPVTVYLAAALGVVAAVGLGVVAVEIVRRRGADRRS